MVLYKFEYNIIIIIIIVIPKGETDELKLGIGLKYDDHTTDICGGAKVKVITPCH